MSNRQRTSTSTGTRAAGISDGSFADPIADRCRCQAARWQERHDARNYTLGVKFAGAIGRYHDGPRCRDTPPAPRVPQQPAEGQALRTPAVTAHTRLPTATLGPARRSLRFHSLFSSPRGLHPTHSVFPSLLETNFPRCRWPSEPELTVALTLWAPRRDGSSILFGIDFCLSIPCDKRSLLAAFLGLDPIALFLGRKESTNKAPLTHSR